MRLGWKTARLKHLARNTIERTESDTDELPFIGLDAIEPWTGRLLIAEGDASEEPQGNRFRPCDVLFGKLRPYLAKVAAPHFHGQCTSEALVLRPTADIDSSFLRYRLVERGFIDLVNSSTFGAKMPRASWSFIGNIPISLPDLPTQKTIAAFLDRETARIDQLIEKKQRLVELLGEKRFSLLDRLTFQHCDAETWVCVPFKWLCRIPSGQVDPTTEPWSSLPLIAPNHIESQTGRLSEAPSAEAQGAISGKYVFEASTVLYSKIRPALAKACIAPRRGVCSADMYPIIPDRSRLTAEYLLMQLLSRRFTDWAVLEAMRVAMPKINRDALGRVQLLSPPLAEQDRLAAQWSRERHGIEGAQDAIESSIDRLKEYRSALITAAVTGQVDVETWSRRGEGDRRLDRIEEEMAG